MSIRESIVIEEILELLETAGNAISLFAVLVIITGFAHAVWDYTKRFSKMEQEDNFKLFKDELGSRLLLGLEILVLAEVVKMITTPTLSSLAVLLAVVLVRTAVSWNLTLTIKGRWPWQTSPEDQESA